MFVFTACFCCPQVVKQSVFSGLNQRYNVYDQEFMNMIYYIWLEIEKIPSSEIILFCK